MDRERKLSTGGDSLYLLLGLPKTATVEEIKKSYRKQALKCHPDKTQGDPVAAEKFKEISYANSVLTDVQKKKIYDEYGSMGIYMSQQLGEERFAAYALSQKPWVKALFVVSCLLTGCCCCCCCFCCFGCCCGKCGPKDPEDYEYQDMPADDDEEAGIGVDDLNPIVDEPTSAGPPIIGMPPPDDKTGLKDGSQPPTYGTSNSGF